ncbi:MAG: hypothetical protein SO454_02900, partial [Candidatus Choladocola sp.]|nr:hypothetical protein [Candidatus Choladocola sp.]
AGLTFACMNLKKLARILDKREERISTIHNIERLLKEKTFFKKSGAGDYLQHQLCLQSVCPRSSAGIFYVDGVTYDGSTDEVDVGQH